MATSASGRTQTIVILKTLFGYKVVPGRTIADLVSEPGLEVAFANITPDPVDVTFDTELLLDDTGKPIRQFSLAPRGSAGFRKAFTYSPEVGSNRYEYSVSVPRAGLEAEGGSRPDIIIVR